MKVIGSGFMKTGTKTMSQALTILGYKTYHIDDQFWHLGDQLVKALNEGCTTQEFREMFKDVDAITDVPSAKLWEEIHRAFPDAKIVHCERASEEEWAESFMNHCNAIRRQRFARLLMLTTATGRKLRTFFDSTGRVATSERPHSLLTMPPTNIKVATMRYREHNARVREIAPKNQTLFFNPKDGWGPLCEFLGVPVPDEPFPHLNKKGALVDKMVEDAPMFMQLRKEMMINLSLLLLFLAIFLCYYFM